LEADILDLVERLKSKRYKAMDIRRVCMPKADGGKRQLGILILEDKIVQKAVSKILSAPPVSFVVINTIFRIKHFAVGYFFKKEAVI